MGIVLSVQDREFTHVPPVSNQIVYQQQTSVTGTSVMSVLTKPKVVDGVTEFSQKSE
jgi:hypothetical protein